MSSFYTLNGNITGITVVLFLYLVSHNMRLCRSRHDFGSTYNNYDFLLHMFNLGSIAYIHLNY